MPKKSISITQTERKGLQEVEAHGFCGRSNPIVTRLLERELMDRAILPYSHCKGETPYKLTPKGRRALGIEEPLPPTGRTKPDHEKSTYCYQYKRPSIGTVRVYIPRSKGKTADEELEEEGSYTIYEKIPGEDKPFLICVVPCGSVFGELVAQRIVEAFTALENIS